VCSNFQLEVVRTWQLGQFPCQYLSKDILFRGCFWFVWLPCHMPAKQFSSFCLITQECSIVCWNQCWRFSCRSWAPLMGDGDDIITELHELLYHKWHCSNLFSGRAKDKFLSFWRQTALQQKKPRALVGFELRTEPDLSTGDSPNQWHHRTLPRHVYHVIYTRQFWSKQIAYTVQKVRTIDSSGFAYTVQKASMGLLTQWHVTCNHDDLQK